MRGIWETENKYIWNNEWNLPKYEERYLPAYPDA